MNPVKQRVAIAEACGWKIENYGPPGYENLYWRLIRPDGSIRELECTGEEWWAKLAFSLKVPDYLNDLNAMHEAEKAIPKTHRSMYALGLEFVSGGRFNHPHNFGFDPFTCHTATAAQRAEAFLKTIGKWEGEA